jgi:unsaturated rhamnogalacturonyl hydrolase
MSHVAIRGGLGRRASLSTALSMLLLAVLALAASTPAITKAAGVDTTLVRSDQPWSVRIARSFLIRHPGAVTYDSLSPDRKWNYEQGLMLQALLRMEERTKDPQYFGFVKANIDQYVDERGVIRTYDLSSYNLDNISPGRALLALYKRTGLGKYKAAADSLRRQLCDQPRTREGGFWHKKIYPYQMWLDGLYMAEPFYAAYAAQFNEPDDFKDIANQFIWVARHTRDPATGLLYHAWDASRQQQWSNPVTGNSPNFWSRAIGWYAMGLVDVLDFFPRDHRDRKQLLGILNDLANAVWRARDPRTCLWFQVTDKPSASGNYLEASSSAMFAYAFARGANEGYLPRKFRDRAGRVFEGMIKNLVTVDPDGTVNLHQTCRGAGLGGIPYRDGSVAYYLGEPRRANDMKGYGSFLLAAIELEGSQP